MMTMGLNNEFDQRLAQIRQSEIDDVEEKARQKEKAESLKRERDLKYAQEQPFRVQKLKQDVDTLFKPLLQAVNESYLENRGKFRESMAEDGSSISIQLDWDEQEYSSGNRLALTRWYHNSDVILELGDSRHNGPTFNMKESDCVNKIQEGIIEALIKGQTKWTHSSGKTDSLEGAF